MAKTPPPFTRDLLIAALDGLMLQRQRLETNITAVRRLLEKSGRSGDNPGQAGRKRSRQMSEAGRLRIIEAQKQRWEAYRRQKEANS